MFSKLVRIFAVAAILALSVVSIFPQPAQAATWWDTDWDYRNVLSFKASTITEDLTDFPVLVTLDSTRIDFDKVKADGADIRFVDDDDATPLDYEIEYWDDVGEEAYIWVEAPQVDKEQNYEDYIYIYYGNDAAVDSQDVVGTWNANYVAVYHMKDGADSSHIYDSTGNNNDGTKTGANEPNEVAGLIGKAQDFSVAVDAIIVSYSPTFGFDGLTDSYTIECLVNSSNPGAHRIMEQVSTVGYPFNFQGTLATCNFYVADGDGNLPHVSFGNIWNGADRYVVGVVNQDTDKLIGYLDGVQYGAQVNNTVTATTANNTDLYLGNRSALNRTLQGLVDEIRFSDIARSAAWLKASYLSQTDDFLYYGSEDPPPTVTTTPATDVNMGFMSTSATLNGTLDGLGGAPAVDIWFEWGYDTSYGNTTAVQSVAAIGDQEADITGYDPAQTVHFRIVGENVDGTTYGADQSFLVDGGGAVAYRLLWNILTVLIAIGVLLVGIRIGVTGNWVAGLIWIIIGAIAIAFVRAALLGMW